MLQPRHGTNKKIEFFKNKYINNAQVDNALASQNNSHLKKKKREKEMATHSSVLAWRIPGTGEPGGLPSVGSHRAGHD